MYLPLGSLGMRILETEPPHREEAQAATTGHMQASG